MPTKFSLLPAGLAVLFTALALVLYVQIMNNTESPGERVPNKYVLPQGFTGKIKVLYEVEDAPPLAMHEGYRVVEIPMSGYTETSSEMLYGTAEDLFVRKTAEGEMEELDIQYLKVRKNGLVGDDNEFYSTAKELENRDRILEQQGRLDENGNPKELGPPYELIEIRDDFD